MLEQALLYNTSFDRFLFHFPSFSLCNFLIFFPSVTFILVLGVVVCFSEKNGSYNDEYHLLIQFR